MPAFEYLVAIACLIIMFAALWACLSENVRDGIPLKISLGMTTVSAYSPLVHITDRTLSMLVLSISAVCLALCYQRFIKRARLFHRSGDRRQHDEHVTQ